MMKLFKTPLPVYLLLVTTAVVADERRATIVTQKSRQSGALVAPPQIKMKVGNATTTIPLADVTLMEFGETDAIRAKSRRDAVKGKIDLADWKFREDKGESPLDRENLRFIIPQSPLPTTPLQKGKLLDAASANGMIYHVRLPPNYNPATGGPAILLFHGSNANSADYVYTVPQVWPKLAADYVLIGISGEWPAARQPGGPLTFNYTYVNFVGKSTYKGFPGTDRESPALVAETIAEIKEQLKLTKIFVGGHSQGGFLTFSCLMNYPDLFAGAFPIAGGLIMQAEPTAYDNRQLRAQQRQRPLVIIHGQADNVVSPDMSTSAYESFIDDAFPAVKLIMQRNAGHGFATLPIEPAIRWLESMASDQPAKLLDFAEKSFVEKDYRSASAALERAETLDTDKKQAARVKTLRDKVESLATTAAKPLQAAMGQENDKWVADFMAFRKQFEFTTAAQPVMSEYLKLRQAHEPEAKKVWSQARQAFQSGARDQGYAKSQEIVDKYYASSVYRYAKGALDQRRQAK